MDISRYETLQVGVDGRAATVRLHRPEARNALNQRMLEELHGACDALEADPDVKAIVLAGAPAWFCTGMDFREAAEGAPGAAGEFAALYGALLRKLSLSGKVLIADLRGETLAGGIGLAAVCDYAFARPDCKFALPEMLWGLLPSMVAPYLIRKVGFRAAYRLTLGTGPIDAQAALAIGLVDEVSDDPSFALARALRRYARLDCDAIAGMKRFFRGMWIVDAGMEERACAETSRLMREPAVAANIRNYVLENRFPWE
jgi:polyketide biosynthesis enoyl-CoA hydratase PksH